jgi:hypothetical protein
VGENRRSFSPSGPPLLASQRDSLDPECPADVADEGNRRGGDIIRHIDNDVEVLLAKGEVESFQSPTDVSQCLLPGFAPIKATFLEKPSCLLEYTNHGKDISASCISKHKLCFIAKILSHSKLY